MKKYLAFIWVLIFGIISGSVGQVIHHPLQNEMLKNRWEWAEKKAKTEKFKSGYWIGYSIEKMMNVHSHICCYHGNHRQGDTILSELIYGMKSEYSDDNRSDDEILRKTAEDILAELNNKKIPEQLVKKEIGILFKFSDRGDFIRTSISNMSLEVDLDELPIIWIGKADFEQSIALLTQLYKKTETTDQKEKMITAVGIHTGSNDAIDFLENVLTGKETVSVREDAAFWLGQQENLRALKILQTTVKNDRSMDVREKAVFGISQMDMREAFDTLVDIAMHEKNIDIREKAVFWLGQTDDPAVIKILVSLTDDASSEIAEKAVFSISQLECEDGIEALINLAKNAGRLNVRKQAIFWLGQRASNKAAAALEHVVYNEKETELQKHAIFAISQLPNDVSVPRLIQIIKSHPNPEIRKKAVFWLGQTEDPRAVDTLVDIIKS